jgi:hypothetical protein
MLFTNNLTPECVNKYPARFLLLLDGFHTHTHKQKQEAAQFTDSSSNIATKYLQLCTILPSLASVACQLLTEMAAQIR